jgi:multidrug efflux pump subunit AcrB
VSFAGWIQVHRRSLLFLMAILALGGLVSSFSLPVSLFPRVNFSRLEVSLE